MIFYYTGESCVKAGKIEVDLGAGPFPIENKIDGFCEGLTNLTTWAIWDCARTVKQAT